MARVLIIGIILTSQIGQLYQFIKLTDPTILITINR